MSKTSLFKNPLLLCVLLLVSGLAYCLLCYLTPRDNFLQVITLFSVLFSIYFFVYRWFSIAHFKYLLFAGIIFRILLFFSVPNLSDDVYRFIWDGRLAINGFNPFRYLPTEIIQMPQITGITNELFGLLNSPTHYTVYPPVLQGIFWLAAKVFPVNTFASIVLLKCIIFLFECGTVLLLIQILKKVSLPPYLSLLYFLNPLVVAELTGNIHFDGVMIFFVLLSFKLLLENKLTGSAIFLGLGISTKLVPVLFLPFLMYRQGWKKGLLFLLICGVTTFLLFALLFDQQTLQHLFNSVNLFIRHFEFNASIYYFVRQIGILIKGYNIIIWAGPVLLLSATSIILFLSFKANKSSGSNNFCQALFIITLWYLFSTTIHPWYICLPVAFSVFTQYRYPIIWSFTATLSYAAYQTNPVKENLWLVGSGYFLMIGYALWEVNKNKLIRQNHK